MKNLIIKISIITIILFVGNVNMYAINSGKKNLEAIEKEMTKKEKRSFFKEVKKSMKDFLKMEKKENLKDKTKADKIAAGIGIGLGAIFLIVVICFLVVIWLISSTLNSLFG